MSAAMPLPLCSRGEIWTLDCGPRRGSEPGGFRPCLILQTDLGNHAPGARTTIVVPLTTHGRPYAFYIPVPKAKGNGLSADSWANCTQLFTLDKSRLIKRLGRIDDAQLARIAGAVEMTLDLG
jgi:mRNA interferase MazF